VETKRTIESTGSDLEKAIAAGLEALGVERDAVEIEELDKGSRGLLGFGSRQARVRLTLRTIPQPQPPEPEPQPQPQPQPQPELELKDEEEEPGDIALSEDEIALFEDTAPIACQTLEELLEKMDVSARVEHYVKHPQEEDDYAKLVLNVCGRDLGGLIGRRGETLNALQYLTRLIVGREVERRVNLIVDVEGYRVRRERSLQQLAHRMAERAVATKRRQVLEPMSPAERRLVHVALRHHPQVVTESIGQGDSRKVTIFVPKKKR
jgi:spoIIIJ-associated protein